MSKYSQVVRRGLESTLSCPLACVREMHARYTFKFQHQYQNLEVARRVQE